MVSLAKAAQAANYPAEIVLVISNCPDAAGLAKALDMGIQAMSIDHKGFEDRQQFEEALDAVLREAKVELICCAGFMRVLTPWFVNRWEGRLLNIHPSLLPKYKGLHTHKRALDNGDTVHGCTVHHVNAELDSGANILQRQIDIKPGDTPDSLATRLIKVELEAYPIALKKVASEIIEAQ